MHVFDLVEKSWDISTLWSFFCHYSQGKVLAISTTHVNTNIHAHFYPSMLVYKKTPRFAWANLQGNSCELLLMVHLMRLNIVNHTLYNWTILELYEIYASTKNEGYRWMKILRIELSNKEHDWVIYPSVVKKMPQTIIYVKAFGLQKILNQVTWLQRSNRQGLRTWKINTSISNNLRVKIAFQTMVMR